METGNLKHRTRNQWWLKGQERLAINIVDILKLTKLT